MSILNRRNAFLGWIVWEAGKQIARNKVLKAAHNATSGSRTSKKKRALVAGAAATVGALLFWRKRSAAPDTFGE
jgi:hypothetical protein